MTPYPGTYEVLCVHGLPCRSLVHRARCLNCGAACPNVLKNSRRQNPVETEHLNFSSFEATSSPDRKESAVTYIFQIIPCNGENMLFVD